LKLMRGLYGGSKNGCNSSESRETVPDPPGRGDPGRRFSKALKGKMSKNIP